jgi:N-acetylglucosamine-6-phosphate deacetylase
MMLNPSPVDFSIKGLSFETGRPVRIDIKGGFISAIEEIDTVTDDFADTIIAPGLIDNQVNGYAGIDFSGSQHTPSDIAKAARALMGEGVTTFLPTLVTASHNDLLRNFDILGKALLSDEQLRLSVPGFHLEGPYISALEGYRGCHQPEYIRQPDWDEFLKYQDAAGGKIIQVTVAPELKGALEFIRKCTEAGIITSIGHTNANAEQISLAVDAGARLSTHLGNGCANLIHRHNNPIWPQLANDLLIPTIIADGHHLLPEEIKVFCMVKGFENIILTSDVVYLSGMKPGKYSFMGSEVTLTPGGMLLNEELNCLAGASFPLIKGVENVMNYTGCSLADAIKMASSNAARIYGLTDRGSLSPGKRADLILLNRDGNKLNVIKTYLNGVLVYMF